MTTTGGRGGGASDGPDRATENQSADELSTDEQSANGSAEGPECPFCGSTDTELESAFGSEVSAEQYYCHGCHTVFERIKFDGDSADTGRRSETDAGGGSEGE